MRRSRSSNYYSFRYTLDVLTDGSEFTSGLGGDGGGSLFLSVWRRRTTRTKKKPNNSKTNRGGDDDDDDYDDDDDDDDDELDLDIDSGVPIARYAINGLGDCTSRLASDQKFKLHNVRALFCCTCTSTDDAGSSSSSSSSSSLWGLPSLLTALRQAGSSSVSVVSAINPTTVEGIVDLFVPPSCAASAATAVGPACKVNICHVPPPPPPPPQPPPPLVLPSGATNKDHDIKGGGCWWKVYEDPYLLVHAQRVPVATTATTGTTTDNDDDNNETTTTATAFLYTLLRYDDDDNDSDGGGWSILLTPNSSSKNIETLKNYLPIIFNNNNNNNNKPRCRLLCHVALSVQQHEHEQEFLEYYDAASDNGLLPFFYTARPNINNNNNSNRIDPRLLVRAQRQSMEWHVRDPVHFPWNYRVNHHHDDKSHGGSSTGKITVCDDNARSNVVDGDENGGRASNNFRRRLVTGTSWIILSKRKRRRRKRNGTEATVTAPTFRLVDRTRSLMKRPSNHDDDDDNNNNKNNDKDSGKEEEGNDDDSRRVWPSRYNFGALTTSETTTPNTDNGDDVDENEINLDDEEEEEDKGEGLRGGGGGRGGASFDIEKAKLKLLCLGTGCAAPSPYRGASGYALRFFNASTSNERSSTLVLEAGEGFVQQWNRYANDNSGTTNRQQQQQLSPRNCSSSSCASSSFSSSLLTIRAIWISHAHWDHYGGLVPLVTIIHDLRMRMGKRTSNTNTNTTSHDGTHRASKRPRKLDGDDDEQQKQLPTPPWVFASDKILRYLELSFGACAGNNKNNNLGEYCNRISLTRESTRAAQVLTSLYDGVVTSFEIVPVDHSCADSCGCIIGLQQEQQQQPSPHHQNSNNNNHNHNETLFNKARAFVFAFSGDTCPCWRFVESCRRFCARRYYSCGGGGGGGGNSGSSNDNVGGVDFLLHEATFHSREVAMSRKKKHSTVSEALRVAQDVNAKRTLLTHFSQRYDQPPVAEEDADYDSLAGHWIPAFDGLSITLF